MDRSSLSYREKIIELVEPVVESGEMELIDVECFRGKSSWMVRIYIDKESGVGLDDCAMISGEIGDLLDINETPPAPTIWRYHHRALTVPCAGQRFYKVCGT